MASPTSSPPRVPPLSPNTPVAVTVTLREEPTTTTEDCGAALRLVARQLPRPGELEPGSWLAVSAQAPKRRGLFRRKRAPKDSERLRLAVCCTALLALGYKMICADDAGNAYGRAPGG